ncbi:MAG: hypothetical protein Q8P81_03080 [Nanoarchaeota archaeon]|nr:hypothetical protein [Nanoarchaeota archaeon]
MASNKTPKFFRELRWSRDYVEIMVSSLDNPAALRSFETLSARVDEFVSSVATRIFNGGYLSTRPKAPEEEVHRELISLNVPYFEGSGPLYHTLAEFQVAVNKRAEEFVPAWYEQRGQIGIPLSD